MAFDSMDTLANIIFFKIHHAGPAILMLIYSRIVLSEISSFDCVFILLLISRRTREYKLHGFVALCTFPWNIASGLSDEILDRCARSIDCECLSLGLTTIDSSFIALPCLLRVFVAF